jgi:plasmid maintenance system killer protein
MQGTSPFALANLGAGAQAGLQSYGAAQDRMANLEEKRYALMNEAAKADRAERQAAITFGENSYQHQAALEQKERLGQAELDVRREANRLTAGFNNARLSAMTDKGLLKSQAEQMIKVNKNIDEQLAYLATAPKSEKITAMINNLLARKAENEAHVKSIYTNLKNPGLAGLETSATNTSDWGDLQVN